MCNDKCKCVSASKLQQMLNKEFKLVEKYKESYENCNGYFGCDKYETIEAEKNIKYHEGRRDLIMELLAQL